MIQLIFSNILLFLVIIFFLFKEEISARLFKMSSPTPPTINPIAESVKKYEQANSDVPPYLLHFMTGQRNAWGLVRLVFFEMYRDNKLLDYDTMINEITERLKKYDKQEVIDSVMAELILYMKSKEQTPGTPNGPSLPGTGMGECGSGPN